MNIYHGNKKTEHKCVKETDGVAAFGGGAFNEIFLFLATEFHKMQP